MEGVTDEAAGNGAYAADVFVAVCGGALGIGKNCARAGAANWHQATATQTSAAPHGHRLFRRETRGGLGRACMGGS